MNAQFLKRVFLVDAITCFASFALLVLAADALAPLLGLSAGFLRGAGWLLLPVAALFGWIATRAQPPLPVVWLGILGNLGWVAASFAVVAAFEPTPVGAAVVIAQALAVLALAVLEYRGVQQVGASA